MIKIKVTTYVPGHPQFVEGSEVEVENSLAQLLLERGAAELTKQPAAAPAPTEDKTAATTSDKKTKKS